MTKREMVAAVCIALGVIASGFVMGYLVAKSDEPVKDYRDVGGNIDIEYYLEVSEDSIWIENYDTHRVYGGKYSQLDSLINVDNL
jgi:hypothetical protein